MSHRFTAGSARFDEDNLVSHAGLVPLLGLAEQTRLPQILAERVSITTPRIKSGAANPAPKLLSVIAGMCAGADSIDDLEVLRTGGMPILFDGIYAPSTLGVLLREFSFGHARQLESVLRHHLVALVERSEMLAGIGQQAFIDIDSLLRPVYGHAKQGASYGHTKIAGKQVLRKGLSPLATTISTAQSAPVIAGMRLRAGKTGSGKGAGRMVAQGIATARAAGASGKILVRGDSAYGNRAVVRACVRGNAEFSLVMTKNPAIARAISAIPDTAWTPVRRGARSRHRGVDLRRRSHRGHLHRLRPHQRSDHRPAGGTPGQRRPLPRCTLSGVAPIRREHGRREAGSRRARAQGAAPTPCGAQRLGGFGACQETGQRGRYGGAGKHRRIRFCLARCACRCWRGCGGPGRPGRSRTPASWPS